MTVKLLFGISCFVLLLPGFFAFPVEENTDFGLFRAKEKTFYRFIRANEEVVRKGRWEIPPTEGYLIDGTIIKWKPLKDPQSRVNLLDRIVRNYICLQGFIGEDVSENDLFVYYYQHVFVLGNGCAKYSFLVSKKLSEFVSYAYGPERSLTRLEKRSFTLAYEEYSRISKKLSEDEHIALEQFFHYFACKGEDLWTLECLMTPNQALEEAYRSLNK